MGVDLVVVRIKEIGDRVIVYIEGNLSESIGAELVIMIQEKEEITGCQRRRGIRCPAYSPFSSRRIVRMRGSRTAHSCSNLATSGSVPASSAIHNSQLEYT